LIILKNGIENKIDFKDHVNNLNDHILNMNKKDEILSKKNVINFLIQFMSNEEKNYFLNEKHWINYKTYNLLISIIFDSFISIFLTENSM
jgi:hypothetical protein